MSQEEAHAKVRNGKEGKRHPAGRKGAQPKPVEKHLVVDDTLKKIIQRVLEELKVPGKIPSEVIFAALAEVRDLVERAAAAGPPAKTR